ncbi:eIF2A-related protein [Floridanema evergladense]|uniref:Caspase family protein n=1 Tax=Floridaenema evergladense BLCC-F167 TaxID=3153639 RepID=A0ABV4WNU0_9CYAN
MTAIFRNLAVVIGINAYRAENGIKPLGTAVNDARAIAQLLKDEYKYSQIWELYDEDATYEAIKTLLNETLLKEVRKSESDRLLFYFAGHGITRKGKDGSPAGYLIPQNAKVNLHNAENDQSENFLPMQELYDAFKTINCHHLLVILDCCYAGMFRWATRKLGSAYERIHQEHYARFIRYPAWQVIASAAHDQEALDLVTDERGAVPGTNHSPFALALLQGLGHTDEKLNADLTEDGVITTPELYFYVDKEVNRSTGERQTPGFWSLRHEFDRGEFIFVKPGFDPKKNLTPAPPLNASNNPYRGLEAFEERHARFFFGRKTLVEELSDRLSKPDRSLTIVLGVSGSGKSSLVKAGLIPLLRNKQEKEPQAQKWYILDSMRPGESPFTALARIILPLEDANLLSQLNQIKGIDEVFKPKTELKENSDRSQKAQQSQSNSEKTDAAFTKLADSWNNSTPEAKLLLIVDYFNQLQEICPSEELTNLENTIQKMVARLASDLQKDPRYLTQVIASWSQINPNIKLLLIIDQFEELITMAQEHQGKSDSDQKEWQQFLSMLTITLASHRHRLHIVATLRSDFEPRFLDSPLKAHWRKGRFPVRAMNSDELREAIEQPARKQALYFEPPDLVGRLIDEVGQMPGALPLLSFTLSELYIKLTKRWIDPNSSDRALRIEDYNQLGGVAGALTRRATEEYENLVKEFGEESGKAHRATLRRVMLRMVTIEGGGVARRRVPESELVYPDAEENKRVVQVSDRLVKARLLVKGQETGESYVEPAHDFLVRGWDKLQEWLKDGLENLALQQRLTPAANDWENNQNVGLLLPDGDRLNQLERILKQPDNWLNAKEKRFIERSIERREALKRQAEILQLTTELQQRAPQVLDLLPISPLEGLLLAVQLIGRNLEKLPNKVLNPVESSLRKALEVAREQNFFRGHKDLVNCVAFSPNGQYIVSGSRDKTVRLWDLHGNQIRQPFKGHTEPINSVAFSPDGQYIISGSQDKTVRLWDLHGNLISQFEGHEANISSVAFSSDGQYIVSGSRDKTVRLWDLHGNQIRQPFKGHEDGVISVAFSPDGQHIVSGSRDKTVRLWDLHGNQIRQPFKGHEDTVISVCFSPDGQHIASTSQDSTIRLWNREGNPVGAPFRGHEGSVISVAFTSNGFCLASGGADGTIRLWDRYGNQICEPLRGHKDAVISVAFSQDNCCIISGSDDSTLRLWDVSSYSFGKPFSGHKDEIIALTFTSDGQYIVSGSRDGTLRVWDRQGRFIKNLFSENKYSISSVAFSLDKQYIAIGRKEGTVQLLNFNGTFVSEPFKVVDDTSINSMFFSPDGQHIVIGDEEGEIRLWDLRTGTQISRSFQGDAIENEGSRSSQFFRSGIFVAISSNNQRIAIGGRTLKLWDLNSDSPIAEFDQFSKTLQKGYIQSLAFNLGSIFATGNSEGTLQLWDLDGNSIAEPIKAFSTAVLSLAFSPDGKFIAGGNQTGRVRLLDLDGNPIAEPFEGDNIVPILSIAFSPDGQYIVSGNSQGEIRLWNLQENWETLLQAACERLCHHQAFKNPQTEVEKAACETCKRYIWHDANS